MSSKWPKIFTREALRELISSFVWSYWPMWGAPTVGLILSYTGGYSPTLIFLICLATFAMIAFGLNNYSQWQANRTPVDKIRFSKPYIGVNIDDSATPPKVRGLKLGIEVRNSAQFPIEVRIDDLETRIENIVPDEEFYSRSLRLSTLSGGAFTNGLIDLSAMSLKNKPLIGKIKASISYGRPGNLRYTADHQIWIAMKFDKDGEFAGAEMSTTELKIEQVH